MEIAFYSDDKVEWHPEVNGLLIEWHVRHLALIFCVHACACMWECVCVVTCSVSENPCCCYVLYDAIPLNRRCHPPYGHK